MYKPEVTPQRPWIFVAYYFYRTHKTLFFLSFCRDITRESYGPKEEEVKQEAAENEGEKKEDKGEVGKDTKAMNGDVNL